MPTLAAIAAILIGQTAPTTQVDAVELVGFGGGFFLAWQLFKPFLQALIDRLAPIPKPGSKRDLTPRPCPISDSHELQTLWRSVAENTSRQTTLLEAIHEGQQVQSGDHKVQNMILERLDRKADR